jgi:uncharacterized oxidoreductase
MPTYSADSLRLLAHRVIAALGTPVDLAAIVANSLVEANLLGHDSHGVIRLVQYANMVRAGTVKPAVRPAVSHTQGAIASVDAGWGWGQPGALLATDTAISLARAHGVGAVTLSHGNHVGRMGEYVERIARIGMIGFAVCNAGANVAPFGGRTRLLGTNPIAFAAPRAAGHDPFLIDLATASVAEGKLRVSREKGESVAPGLLLDKDGQPSQDPNAFYAGGALLPFGGHKGYGLSVMVELLGGALSGSAPASSSEFVGGNGTLLLALAVPGFVSAEQFERQAEELYSKLTDAPTAPGVSVVQVPGDPEWSTRRKRLAEGIMIPEPIWAQIAGLQGA